MDFKNLLEKYKDADMVLFGIGSELHKSVFENDAQRIEIIDYFNQFIDKKNYFIITTHQSDLFEGTKINRRRLCNPLISGEEAEKQWDLYNKWLSATLNKKLLILELGEDFNRPNVFRWPFEKVVFINQKSFLCRVNSIFYQLPENLGDRAESINVNAFEMIKNLKMFTSEQA